jgi:D-alanyl-D-alanine carboxypeptidase
MAFAPVEKIKSFLKIPAVYAAEDEESERAGTTPDDNARNADAEDAGAQIEGRRANIKSLDELLSTELPEETTKNRVPAEAEAQAEAAPADTSAEAEARAEPEAAPQAETPAESETRTEGPAEDPTLDIDVKSLADLLSDDGLGPSSENAAASDAGGENTASAPSSDEDRQRLHNKALRFANGRTGLLGLLRQLREAVLIVAALAAKAFIRSKTSASKRKTKKLEFSEDVERSLSKNSEAVPVAEDAAAFEQAVPESAQAVGEPVPEAPNAKKKTTPHAKNATIKTGAKGSAAASSEEAPPDKAAAKKAKAKEKAAAKKIKDDEKKAAKKAKDEAKKAVKKAKEEEKQALKEAKEAAFAEKYPKKAAKRAEQAAKKEAKKAAKDAKKKAKPDAKSVKAAKDAVKAAKKAKKAENKKPKLTKDEKFRLKLEKQAAKHEKKIERFEQKARKIEQRLEKKHQKKEILKKRRDDEGSLKKEQRRIRKERKREIKAQKKYWLKKGVGRAGRNASVVSLVFLIVAAFVTGTAFLYKSDRVNIPILNSAVQTLVDSPLMHVAKFLDKPVHVAIQYAAIPVSYVIHLIRGEPKIEDVYFFEADKLERYETFKEANPDLSADEVVWRVNAGADLPLYQDPVRISDFDKQPILINKFHSVPAEYEPQGMVQISDTVLMRANPDAVKAFARMREAAAQENLNITVASAYRSYEYQNLIYNPNVSDTREKQDNFLSRPGFSENQSGLAFDLSANNGRMYDFAGTPEAAWTAENAEDFGFILRYPAGQEDVTGVPHQPWHIRYVGDAVVKTMRENDIETLEEYCVKFVDHKPGDKPEKPEKDDAGMTEDTNGPI